eukprot:3002716-Prymnesium_polylepis.2
MRRSTRSRASGTSTRCAASENPFLISTRSITRGRARAGVGLLPCDHGWSSLQSAQGGFCG